MISRASTLCKSKYSLSARFSKLTTFYHSSAISFLLGSGPADQAQTWASLSDADRKAAKKAYNDAGISVIVSAFG